MTKNDLTDMIFHLAIFGPLVYAPFIVWVIDLFCTDQSDDPMQVYTPTAYKLTITGIRSKPVEYLIGADTTPEQFIAHNGGDLLRHINKLITADPLLSVTFVNIAGCITVQDAAQLPNTGIYSHPNQDQFKRSIELFVYDFLGLPMP